MESAPALIKIGDEENQLDVKGNGNLKRKHGADAGSDEENDFLGFDLAEQNDSQHMIQNIKKICTDSSSDETTPRRQAQGIALRTTDVADPAYKVPFKYGWKRELVLRAEPQMSKEKGEVYYITPTGKKLRTRHEIMNNLHDDLTINNFTLVKEAIGAPADDEIIRPAKFYNYSRRSNVDPVIAEASPPLLGKRVPKPKMPKGASPPPATFQITPTSSANSVPLFTPNHNKNFSSKENMQDVSKASSPTRKTAVKGKLKPAQKPSGQQTGMNRSQSELSVASSSPFNFSTNFLQNVSAGFAVLLHTFQYLKVQELQRASRVCRMWNAVAQNNILWRTVRMKNSHVNDWEGFVKTLKKNETNHLDLRKVLMGNQEEAWREFSEMIGRVDQLEGIDLCRCQANVVESLFLSNTNLRIINALSLKDEKISLEGLKDRRTVLEELRIRSVHASGLQVLNFDFAPLLNLRHLSLTTVENLNLLFNDNSQMRELKALETLEIGHCDQLNDDQFAENLSHLESLQRLRIEKGSQNFNINKILDVIAKNLRNLVQLELINCDVKNNFVEAIRECRNVKRLLLIPTYVSQSAATNFMIMEGVMHLTNLDTIHWVVTNELLRVTELYLDQSDNRSEKGKKSPEKQIGSGASSPVKARDCIPVLKPVPGKEETEEETSGANKQQQQVEIVALKTVEAILQKRLTTTTVKLIKIPHQSTWRQVIESM